VKKWGSNYMCAHPKADPAAGDESLNKLKCAQVDPHNFSETSVKHHCEIKLFL